MCEGIVLDVVDFVYESGQIYFIAYNKPFIWQYDYAKGRITLLKDFSENIVAAGAFVRLIKVEEKIYCIPCYADNIYCCNLKTEQFYSLNISKKIFNRMPRRKIIEPVNLNGTLYCVCRSPHLIIEINTLNDTYSFYEFQNIRQEHNFFTVRVQKETIVYPFLQNQFVCFNIRNKEYQIKTLYKSNSDYCEEDRDIYNFEYDSFDGIWWSDFRGEVYHIENDNICQITMPDHFIGQYQDNLNRDRPGINGMIFMGSNLCFVLGSDYKILQYDVIEKKFIWSENPGKETFNNQEIYFRYNKLNEKKLMLYSRGTKCFYVWEMDRGFIDRFCIRVPAKLLAENEKLQLYCEITNESFAFNLQYYFEYLKFWGKDQKAYADMDRKVGRTIYKNNKD